MVKGLSIKRNESYRLITNWNFLSFFSHNTVTWKGPEIRIKKREGRERVVGNTGFYQIQIVVNNSERYQTGELCLDCLGRIPVKIVNQKTL